MLKCTGPLNVESASDATKYLVEVNGVQIGAESVFYSASTSTVTLSLAAGAFGAGDAVSVAWSGVLDRDGLTLRGQAGPVQAR